MRAVDQAGAVGERVPRKARSAGVGIGARVTRGGAVETLIHNLILSFGSYERSHCFIGSFRAIIMAVTFIEVYFLIALGACGHIRAAGAIVFAEEARFLKRGVECAWRALTIFNAVSSCF